MADNNQNKAEAYRQERKDRLAKSAKKNAKNIEKSTKLRSAVKKVIAIVIAAVIALGCAFGILNYCGVVRRAVNIGYCGDEKLSMAEYVYYYYQTYNSVYQNATYYSYYGYDYGYDTSLTPEEQTKKTKNEAGEEVTWSEYFREQAVNTAQLYMAVYQEAKKAGVELDDADKAQIDKSIEEMRETARTYGNSDENDETVAYSLNAFLRLQYGYGITESFFKHQLKVEAIARKFYQQKQDEFAKGYSDDEVKAVFDKDKDAYQFVDLRVYTFTKEELQKGDDETDDQLKARQDKSDKQTEANAKAMFAAIKDEASFIAQANTFSKNDESFNIDSTNYKSFAKTADQNSSNGPQALSSVNEDLAKWAFAKGTKAGDKKLITDKENGTYYVALMTNPKHDVNTVTIRHILFKTVDDENKALSDSEIQKAEKKAKETLTEWKAGEKTEESFASYAVDLSEDSNASSGGIYENVVPGQMVKTFNDWIFDTARKTGDCDIVKTEYGYHIIYFVGNDGVYYNTKIRNDKAAEDLNTYIDGLTGGEDYVIGIGPRRVDYIEKKVLDKISYQVANANANKAASSSAY